MKLFEQINLVSYFYGALISSFLCGMQWIKFIDKKKIFIYSNDSIHITMDFIFFFRKNIFSINCYFKSILVPNVDISILKKVNKKWFKKMRIIITIIAILPLLYNLFINKINKI